MRSWLADVMVYWPIAAFMTPVLLAVGLLWLRTKFAGIAEFNKIATSVTSIETKLKLLDQKVGELDRDIDSEPTRAQVLERIANVTERLSRVEAAGEANQRQLLSATQSIERQLTSQSQYIQSLVEQGMRK